MVRVTMTNCGHYQCCSTLQNISGNLLHHLHYAEMPVTVLWQESGGVRDVPAPGERDGE